MHASRTAADRTIRAVERAFEEAEPPRAPEDASLFEFLKTTVLAVDHRVAAVTRKAMAVLDPELHLCGRPFFVTEASAERVAAVVHDFRTAPSPAVVEAKVIDQLARLDPTFPAAFAPVEDEISSGDLEVRRQLLAAIEFTVPEFTCLCPKTGQPDFATFRISYVPDRRCVELKSLKLYFWSFRNEGHFHEAVTNLVLDDLVAILRPRRMEIVGDFFVRGGIHTVVRASHEGGRRRRSLRP